MTEKEFFDVLSKTTKAYKWQQTSNGQIYATGKNHVDKSKRFSPIGVVKRFLRKPNLNMDKVFEKNVKRAVSAKTNRGHVQVIRGRIKKATQV